MCVAMLNFHYAHAQAPAVEEHDRALERKLAESETKVRMLQQRLERLESRFELLTAEKNLPSSNNAIASAKPREMLQTSVSPQTEVQQTAQAGTNRTRPRAGTFEVDEEAAQRALERTLTQTGVLLLPEGSLNITPSLTYARNEITVNELLEVSDPDTGDSNLLLSNSQIRRNEFTARADVKYGLPKDMQLELGLPYQYVRSSSVDPFGDGSRNNGSGVGDITIGIAKTFMREKGIYPDLIGRLTYNTGSGRANDNQVSLDGGYRQVSGEILALKRQDPLAFYAGAAYSHVFEENNIKPGSAFSFSLGAALAASPATSLQFGFSQIHRQRQEVDNVKVYGSDQTYGVVSIGTSTILSRNTMLQTTIGIGVGDDAPDYSLSLALPINF